MSKNNSGAYSEPAQPLLPGINLVRCLCDSCELTTWQRRSEDWSSVDAAAGVVRSAPPALPPHSNTGVHHATLKRGASEGKPLF